MSLCNSLMFFIHKSCRDEMQKLIQSGLDDQKKIQSLNSQIMVFVNQIQELKGINDYQNWELERKIIELEKELALLVASKSEKEANV